MACFLVSAAEGAIVKVFEKVEEKREIKRLEAGEEITKKASIPLSKKLRWLSNMLFGGSALLAFEHIWHGEVVPWFPFLSAMSDSADAAEMFREMATVGVSMAGLITCVWIVMCIVSEYIAKRPVKEDEQSETLQTEAVHE